MRRIVTRGFLALALVGCTAFGSEAVQRAQEEGIPASHIVSLDDAAIGTRLTGNDLAVLFVHRDKDGELQSYPLADAKVEPGMNRFFFSSGAGLGLSWNTFLFGSAAPGVTRVSSTLPNARGGEVVDGVWVIASPVEGLSMGDVSVTFLDNQGGVVEQQ